MLHIFFWKYLVTWDAGFHYICAIMWRRQNPKRWFLPAFFLSVQNENISAPPQNHTHAHTDAHAHINIDVHIIHCGSGWSPGCKDVWGHYQSPLNPREQKCHQHFCDWLHILNASSPKTAWRPYISLDKYNYMAYHVSLHHFFITDVHKVTSISAFCCLNAMFVFSPT